MRTWEELSRDTRFYLSRTFNRSLAPPDWLTINLTLRCNLTCIMCTTCYDSPELSKQEVLDLIDQAAAWGVRVFNPLGGEPFVRHDLEDILLHASRRAMFVTLTSNGTLIHKGRATKIAQVPPEQLHINLSIDGPEAIHDHIRGKGMFQRTLDGYRRLREADAAAGNPVRKICANAILNRMNLDVYEELLDFLHAEGFSAVQVLNLFREGTEKTGEELWFDDSSLPKLEALTERLAQRAEAGEGVPLINRPADLRLIPRYYREGIQPLEAPCWAGWKELYVNADGTTIMCDGKLDFLKGRFGDVRKQTLRELWQSPELQARRQVVKTCTTPCIQNCYLRRSSDSGRELLQDAGRNLARPLEARLGRYLPWSDAGRTLTLELSDIPEDLQNTRMQALIRRSPVPFSEVWDAPERYLELRDHGYLDTSRGFMGLEIIERILGDFARMRLRFPVLALRWRGEPLLHPELVLVMEHLRKAKAEGRIQTIRVVTSGQLLGPTTIAALAGAEVWVDPRLTTEPAHRVRARAQRMGAKLGAGPEERGIFISWDGKLTTERSDAALRRRVGDVLHEPMEAVWAKVV